MARNPMARRKSPADGYSIGSCGAMLSLRRRGENSHRSNARGKSIMNLDDLIVSRTGDRHVCAEQSRPVTSQSKCETLLESSVPVLLILPQVDVDDHHRRSAAHTRYSLRKIRRYKPLNAPVGFFPSCNRWSLYVRLVGTCRQMLLSLDRLSPSRGSKLMKYCRSVGIKSWLHPRSIGVADANQ